MCLSIFTRARKSWGKRSQSSGIPRQDIEAQLEFNHAKLHYYSEGDISSESLDPKDETQNETSLPHLKTSTSTLENRFPRHQKTFSYEEHERPIVRGGDDVQGFSIPSAKLPPIGLPLQLPGCRCELDSHKLCGVLIYPKPPKPKDGKIVEDEKPSSSKQSKVMSSSQEPMESGKVDAEGSGGSGCGPLSIPGITPWPKPQNGDFDYDKRLKKWNLERENWKDITCPCGRGYFDDNGLWISGGQVRAHKRPGNPRWVETDFRQPSAKIQAAERFQGKLYDRE